MASVTETFIESLMYVCVCARTSMHAHVCMCCVHVYKLAVTTYTAMFTLNVEYIIKFHITLVIVLTMQQKDHPLTLVCKLFNLSFFVDCS